MLENMYTRLHFPSTIHFEKVYLITLHTLFIFRDALICTAADGFTSFYGGFVIFSVIGYMAKEANLNIEDVATSGYTLSMRIYTLLLV